MDAVRPTIDFLPLEWYEVNRRVLKRKTDGGILVCLCRPPRTPIHDGEIVYTEDGLVVKAFIKPCTCIVLDSDDLTTVGSFCFDVGNRHLPIFFIDGDVVVSYDGRLFQALSQKYAGAVRVATKVLHAAQSIKAFGNYL